jgi:hypothetical protein
MAKKIVLGLLVLAVITGILGAQEDADPQEEAVPAEQTASPAAPAAQTAGDAKMAISLDVFPLVKGLLWSDSDLKNSLFALAPNFEYLLHPHYTLGAAVDLYFGKTSDIDILYFGLTAHGRWYPLSSGLDKFFLDAGLGFNMFSLDGKTDSDRGGFSGITISLKAGYKLMFGSRFFLEPSMAFVYAKTASIGFIPTPLGWQPGLNMGITF